MSVIRPNISGNAATATKLQTASGTAPSYSARAWVNFNGTGTVAIRASGNVSSITDNGTGNYDVNFTNAMEDDAFTNSITGCTKNSTRAVGLLSTQTAAKLSFVTVNNSAMTSVQDFDTITVSVNR